MVQAKAIDPQAFTNIVDKHEISLVIDEEKIDEANAIEISRGWKVITLDILFPDDCCGVTAMIAGALADAGISVMPLAAFSRDHFLVQEENLEKAIRGFQDLGITFKS